MAGSVAETLIGAVVLVAAGGFLVYASNTADTDLGRGGYELVAKFRKAEGLNRGSDVRIAGVKVGSVRDMTLDPQSYRAVISISMRGGVEVPEDSSAKITAASLLGDNFIAISPGAAPYMLENGDEITYTQGSVNLLDLAGKLIGGGGIEEDGSGDGGGSGGSTE